ncbi:MAG: 4-alpha-glucanotransferase [Ruminococcus sp.]|uniref:4-alpha-glucanotransferase n=1 Tax=Ruminococcus sp. TaxID=41978 RepID=UPI0025E73C93|nr:4-alpha-glucanotransferase [Ruminococcus sp.]MBR5684469.1 4-alpha-glucanotransferase [Ruminococcus sp.]
MRKSCILMHISSLPSNYGIGKMGKAAFEFVDFLRSAGVKCWQILPISPTSYGDSPYQSFSVNAGNPYFIDFEVLEGDGLLERHEYDMFDWENEPDKVDYALLYDNCYDVLRIAFERFKPAKFPDYRKFCTENKKWLDEYALFMALKFRFEGKPWYSWDGDLAMHKPKAVAQAKKDLKKDVNFHKFIQFEFSRQWKELKKYANDSGIEIIGDIPIYCALDSVEAWASPKLFYFDKERRPIAVAGCPPDDFSPLGQLWGNPLYDWDYHKKTGYEWWIDRIGAASRLYDIVRIDHFRGFESYYTIPYGNEDATVGEWKKGPNYELFKLAEKKLGKLKIIAEDLGFITPEVRKMLDKCGYPGMKVLQFAFSDGVNEYLPHNFRSTNYFAYTGTHDNETLSGWVDDLDKKSLKFAMKYLNVKKKKDIPDAVIRAAWGSVAEVAAAQIQDFLESPPEGRMNTPSTLGGNWQFRTKKSDFTPELAKKIRKLNKMYNR